MQNPDPLIDEILKLPGKVHVSRAQPAPRRLALLTDDDASWDLYAASHALSSGLQVTEREVPAELCRAVFPLRMRYSARR